MQPGASEPHGLSEICCALCGMRYGHNVTLCANDLTSGSAAADVHCSRPPTWRMRAMTERRSGRRLPSQELVFKMSSEAHRQTAIEAIDSVDGDSVFAFPVERLHRRDAAAGDQGG